MQDYVKIDTINRVDRMSGEVFYKKECASNDKWFCGYDGERKLILDEFRGSAHIAMEKLNSWLQPHPSRVEPKFGSAVLIAEHFVLTSPMHPVFWYPKNLNSPHDSIDQLLRRITAIYEHYDAAGDLRPPAGVVYQTVRFQNETVHIVETRRRPTETNRAWCDRVRAMHMAQVDGEL